MIWRKGDRSIANGAIALPVQDLDSLPLPQYHDWLDQYRLIFPESTSAELALTIETSRGCWYGQKHHCIFCGNDFANMPFRYKSPHRVITELKQLSQFHIRQLTAVDLIFPIKYFHDLLPKLQEEKHEFDIFFEVKANLSKEQIEALHASGITQIQPGIESLSTPILELMHKGTSALQNIRLLKWSAEFGVTLEWNMLYGIPGETAEHYWDVANLIPKLRHLRAPTIGLCHISLNRFSPLHSQYSFSR